MNEEQFQEYRNTLHDALEEVILDLDSRMDKKSSAIEGKIDELNENVRELVKVLNKIV